MQNQLQEFKEFYLNLALSPVPVYDRKAPTDGLRFNQSGFQLTYSQYAKHRPPEYLMRQWWKHQDNQLGVVLTADSNIVVVDIDPKDFRDDGDFAGDSRTEGEIEHDARVACHNFTKDWLHKYGLEGGLIERTGSGGFHVFLEVPNAAELRKVQCMSLDGQRAGQLLVTGSFVVTAPTEFKVGELAGRKYTNISRQRPHFVESLESVGIAPCKGTLQHKSMQTDKVADTYHRFLLGDSKPQLLTQYGVNDLRRYAPLIAPDYTKGGEVAFHCPVHGDTHKSASLNMDTGLWHCHAHGCKTILPKTQQMARTAGLFNGDEIPEEDTRALDGNKDYFRFLTLDVITPTQVFQYGDLVNGRYMPDAAHEHWLTAPTVFVRAPKGTGKTVQTAKYLAKKKAEGYRVVFLSPRVALAKNLGKDYGLTYIQEAIDNAPMTYMANSYLAHSDESLGLCYDSLGKLRGIDWTNVVLVLDEAEQGIQHLLQGRTCRKDRQNLVEVFHDAVSLSHAVIAGDADLSNTVVNYLMGLRGSQPYVYTLNTHAGVTYPATLYKGKEDIVYTQLFTDVKNGLKVIVSTDSKAKAHGIEKQLLSMGVSSLIISSDTTSDPATALVCGDFISDPDKYLETFAPQVVVYTPSLTAGVSIDQHYFDKQYAFFTGAVGAQQAAQMLARVRESIPRVIHASKRSPMSGYDTITKEKVFDLVVYKGDTAYAEIAGALMELSNILKDDAPKTEEAIGFIVARFGDSLKRLHISHPLEWLTFSELAAREGYSHVRFFETLLLQLRSEGHQIEVIESTVKTAEGEQQKELKKEYSLEWAERIVSAPFIDETEAEALAVKGDLNSEEQLRLTRYRIVKQLGSNAQLTPELVYELWTKDKGETLWRVKRHVNLFYPNSETERYLRNIAASLNGEGDIYLPDLELEYDRHKFLYAIGLHYFNATPEETYVIGDGKLDPALSGLIDETSKRSRAMKRLYGKTLTHKTPTNYMVRTLNQLFQSIGLKLVSTNRTANTRTYSLQYESPEFEYAVETMRQHRQQFADS